MILCAISEFERWAGLHPRFPRLAEFLGRADLRDLPEGRTEIEGEDLFVLVSRGARTRVVAEAPLEAHRTFIDVQLVLEGVDTMGWSPLSACQDVSLAYDAQKDVVFFREKPKSLVPVSQGHLAIFFPEDAHAPLIGGGEAVWKMVAKVRA